MSNDKVLFTDEEVDPMWDSESSKRLRMRYGDNAARYMNAMSEVAVDDVLWASLRWFLIGFTVGVLVTVLVVLL